MKKELIFYVVLSGFLGAFLLCPVAAFGEGGLPLEKIFYLAQYNAEAGVASLAKNWSKVDIVAPQMYTLQANFTITGGLGPKLKKLIKDHKLNVMPLVANAHFSQQIIHNLLVSPTDQDKVIMSLVNTAKSQKYMGWQFDFENISYLDKDLFTAFVQKAYPIFKKNNLIFSVAVVPRATDYEDTDAFKNWGGVYDYQKIADSTDFVSLMTYDDSNSVGPVASIDFVNKVLAYVKDKIPAQKLSLGVPLYYWRWSLDTGKKAGSGAYKNALAIMTNFRYNVGFDANLGVSWLIYFLNNKGYKIWFEDKKSFQAKLNIVQSNNLRGFSAWLLGGEDQGIWSILVKTIGPIARK